MSSMSEPANRLIVPLRGLGECRKLAELVAGLVITPMCIGLDGTLGAGKTQWTRYFVSALGADEQDITSPTFVLVHRYLTTPVVNHLDAYRIRDDDEFLELGVDEMFYEDAVTIIEWASRVGDCLPEERWMIDIEVVSEVDRRFQLEAFGARSIQTLQLLRCKWHSDLGRGATGSGADHEFEESQ